MPNNTNDIIYVKANIYLRTLEDGGRKTPIKTNYRPNHVFEKFTDLKKIKTFVGQIEFTEQELIYPGETKTVMVKFLRFGGIEKYIIVGQKWLIYEVPRLIGEAEIIEVLLRPKNKTS